jgi:hypothetical protein
MAVVILASVFVGFARTYYLAGVFKAPLPNLLIHIHGLVFSCWILLLIVQTSLVAAGRVDVHRRLGLLGFGLACLVVVLGLLAATDQLARHFAPGEAGVRVRAFYSITLTVMLAFSTLIYLAFRSRFNPAARKRLILIATIAILDAAFERWRVPVAWGGARGGAHLHRPVAVIDHGLRLLVQGQGSSSLDLGEPVRGRAAASAGPDRAFRPLAGFRPVDAGSCAFFTHMKAPSKFSWNTKGVRLV